MSVRYLIDGYNLLHAMGILNGKVGPQGLEKARRRLLGFLRGAHGEGATDVTVVFDAGAARPGDSGAEDCDGLHVRFAVGYPQADDLIELLIRQAAVPRRLHVVSDDHRIQRAARRRRCRVLGCLDYLEGLDRPDRPPPPLEREKEDRPSEGETQRWLAEFADLADDPDLKELFEPFDFQEE